MNSFFASAHPFDRMSNNTARSFATVCPLFIAVVLLGGMVVVGAQSSVAQVQDSRSSSTADQRVQDPNSQSSPGLPSWAEPSSPTSDRTGTAVQKQSSTNAPAPPDNPSRLPVDGGLALLAAAGAGYAVRKLQNEDDEV